MLHKVNQNLFLDISQNTKYDSNVLKIKHRVVFKFIRVGISIKTKLYERE